VEISTWAQLNQHRKPIIIANIQGYWEPLLALVQHMREEKFIRPGLEVRYEVVERAEDVVPVFLKQVQAPSVEAAEVHAVRSHG
jgi:predicted Rossmann-fold nucleotide-binding protein